MPFDRVVKNCTCVAFIHKKLGEDAPDIARPASDEDSHGRGKCSGTRVKSKRTARGRRLGDGFALLFFKGCNHPPYGMIFSTRREHFPTLFLRAPLQNVDVKIAYAPHPHP